jgi:hypothetical protein
MEMVRDDGAASSTQRTITVRDVDRRWQWRIVAPVVVAALPADRAGNHLGHRYLGRAGPSSAHEMMPSLV